MRNRLVNNKLKRNRELMYQLTYWQSRVRNRGHVSSEAFPLNLELFLSGGAGAPLAPLAETPMCPTTPHPPRESFKEAR